MDWLQRKLNLWAGPPSLDGSSDGVGDGAVGSAISKKDI